METLNDIAKEIADCKSCPLHKERNCTVPGSGKAETKIMFIGEAPGKNEDLQGVPFVGAAGKILDELLKSIQLDREDVYIANVVKCRPPSNRDPEPKEVKACWGFLERQVASIKPKLVVNLGRHSMDRFLPGLQISKDHGKPKRRKVEGLGTLVFYPIYHPAAALYNPSLKEALAKDFARIPKILKLIQEEK